MKRILYIFLLLVFCQQNLNAQTPSITVSPSYFCVPGIVTLELVNCATCNAWEWDLGSGYKTGTSKYQAVINTSGVYNVTVKYTTTSGNVSTVTLKNAFNARAKPSVNFSLNSPVLCNADSVIMTDITPFSMSREWFIEGTNYKNAPKSLKLGLSTSKPYKSVFLLVKDSWGCVNNKLTDSAFAVFDSVTLKMLLSTTVGCAPKAVNFTTLIDSGGQSIKNFQWTFPGAIPGSSIQRNPKNIYYATADTYDVKVVINTNGGCTYSYFENNVVSLGDSTALNLTTSKTQVCVNEVFTLSNSNSKTNKLQWTITGAPFSSDTLWGKIIKGRIRDTGKINVSIQENNKGCISTKSISKLVTALGPKASFTNDLAHYCSFPDTINLKNTSVEALGTITWNWRRKKQCVQSCSRIYSQRRPKSRLQVHYENIQPLGTASIRILRLQ